MAVNCTFHSLGNSTAYGPASKTGPWKTICATYSSYRLTAQSSDLHHQEQPRIVENQLKAAILDIHALLTELAKCYPPNLVQAQLRDVPRTAFHMEFIIRCVHRQREAPVTIADIGGGIGLFSLGCATLGIRTILVDDFQDPINHEIGDSVLALHRSRNVEIVVTNVVDNPPNLEPESLDAVVSFDCLEHWHHSPKRLFQCLRDSLKPGGLFFLSAPNCVNLRKRITVPLGYGKWSSMADWYERERFRGHVREPDVDDLRYIARSMGLDRIKILGRNWLGRANSKALVRAVTRLTDPLVRLHPPLCSDIYLSGVRPRAEED